MADLLLPTTVPWRPEPVTTQRLVVRATEAVAAVLLWAAQALSDLQILACTQTANAASAALLRRLGFDDTGQRFIEFDAEQSLWVRSLPQVSPP